MLFVNIDEDFQDCVAKDELTGMVKELIKSFSLARTGAGDSDWVVVSNICDVFSSLCTIREYCRQTPNPQRRGGEFLCQLHHRKHSGKYP